MLAIAMIALFAAASPAQEDVKKLENQEIVLSEGCESAVNEDAECLEEIVIEDAAAQEDGIVEDAIAFDEES